MNTKLAVIAIAALVVGAIVVASLGSSTTPSTTSPPSTPVYVDSVTMDSAIFPDNTSATLQLREDGNATAMLTSYSVTDSSGNSYFSSGWPDQTIPPSTQATVNILIGNECSSCTLSGATFTFAPGHTYSITVYASDGRQFSFQLTREHSSYQVSLSVGFGTTGQP